MHRIFICPAGFDKKNFLKTILSLSIPMPEKKGELWLLKK